MEKYGFDKINLLGSTSLGIMYKKSLKLERSEY